MNTIQSGALKGQLPVNYYAKPTQASAVRPPNLALPHPYYNERGSYSAKVIMNCRHIADCYQRSESNQWTAEMFDCAGRPTQLKAQGLCSLREKIIEYIGAQFQIETGEQVGNYYGSSVELSAEHWSGTGANRRRIFYACHFGITIGCAELTKAGWVYTADGEQSAAANCITTTAELMRENLTAFYAANI